MKHSLNSTVPPSTQTKIFCVSVDSVLIINVDVPDDQDGLEFFRQIPSLVPHLKGFQAKFKKLRNLSRTIFLRTWPEKGTVTMQVFVSVIPRLLEGGACCPVEPSSTTSSWSAIWCPRGCLHVDTSVEPGSAPLRGSSSLPAALLPRP